MFCMFCRQNVHVLQRLGKFSSRFLGAVVPHPRPADWAASCSIDSVSCRAASRTTGGIGRLGLDIKNLGLSGDETKGKKVAKAFPPTTSSGWKAVLTFEQSGRAKKVRWTTAHIFKWCFQYIRWTISCERESVLQILVPWMASWKKYDAHSVGGVSLSMRYFFWGWTRTMHFHWEHAFQTLDYLGLSIHGNLVQLFGSVFGKC